MRATETTTKKRDQTWVWTKEHDETSKNIKKVIQNITERNYFKLNSPIPKICDASRERSGLVLQPQTE